LDIVLATSDVAARVQRAHVDPDWTAVDADYDSMSDHAPVWFEIPHALGGS
jgi:exonuclease III